MFERPHRRLNALSGEWILVSPQRTARPWDGKRESSASERPAYDPGCYLCPRNERAGGHRNPDYEGPYAFDNDYPALLSADGPHLAASDELGLFRAETEDGFCRVVCFSPRHDLSLPELSPAEVDAVLRMWTEETRALAASPGVGHVLVFENKGEVMGCSNPHPHSQIWATSWVPTEPSKEWVRQVAHYEAHGRPLLADYLDVELCKGERVIVENESFVALVPYWALWPFETLVLPKGDVRTLLDLRDGEREALGDVLRRLTIRYDNLFEMSFPYSMGFHQAPFDDFEHPEWRLHVHFYPPLLRGPTIKKFMVGFEMLGMPGRDLTPEAAAERLRALPDVHYKGRGGA